MHVSGSARPETFSCPACGSLHSVVKNTGFLFDAADVEGIARLRECTACQHRYTTKEVICPVKIRRAPRKMLRVSSGPV